MEINQEYQLNNCNKRLIELNNNNPFFDYSNLINILDNLNITTDKVLFRDNICIIKSNIDILNELNKHFVILEKYEYDDGEKTYKIKIFDDDILEKYNKHRRNLFIEFIKSSHKKYIYKDAIFYIDVNNSSLAILYNNNFYNYYIFNIIGTKYDYKKVAYLLAKLNIPEKCVRLSMDCIWIFNKNNFEPKTVLEELKKYFNVIRIDNNDLNISIKYGFTNFERENKLKRILYNKLKKKLDENI